MKKFAKIGCLLIALPLIAIIGYGLWLGISILLYKPSDDQSFIESKSAYLSKLESKVSSAPADRPNILIIYYDDLGYGDFSFTGSNAIKTPNIDALARSGIVLDNYHSPSPVCSPSRAGLLTGRLPVRAGVPEVLFPSGHPLSLMQYANGDANRLLAEEITIADILKASGYRTGMIGKWHLGDTAPSLPNNFGFDSYYGAHYSNDIAPFAIYRNDKVVMQAPADQSKIDAAYTREAVSFIRKSDETKAPFFLYFAHNFPHEPLFAAQDKIGKSAGGLYGDVVQALDDGVGEIIATLTQTGQIDNTIIILTSDNGPWYEGNPGNSRGRKGQTFEGGTHVPFLIHWPARLNSGQTISAPAMGTDILPTLLDWLSLPLPQDRAIDGASLRALLEGLSQSAHDYLYFYSGKQLLAVSDGRFKYLPAQPVLYGPSGMRLGFGITKGPWLFDLKADPQESYNVAMKYPAEAKRLKMVLDAKNAEMDENPRGWKTLAPN